MLENDYRKSSNNKINIDFYTIAKDLFIQWFFIVLVAIGSLFFAFSYYVSQYNPTYSVSTVLSISTNSSDLTSGTANYISTFSSLLNNNILRNMVVEEIGTSKYTLTITPVEETNIITVTSFASSPYTAFVALRSTLKNYPILTDKLLSDVLVTVLQQPQVSSEGFNYVELFKFLAVGMLVGVGLFCAVITFLSVMRDTVKQLEDFDKIDTELLGVLPVLKLSKKAENKSVLIHNPLCSAEYVEQYYLAASRIIAKMKKANAKTLLVTSCFPNEGKTTTVINLGVSIARTGKKVLVLGADFRNPTIDIMLNGKKDSSNQKYNLSKALQNGKIDVNSCVNLEGTNVKMLYNTKADKISYECANNGTLQKLLESIYDEFDYILLDSGPVTLVSETELLARMADASLLVVFQDIAAIPVINDVIDMLTSENGEFLGCIYRNISGFGFGFGKRSLL